MKRKGIKTVLITLLPISVILIAAFVMYRSEHFVVSAVGGWDVVERVIVVLMGEYPQQPATVVGRIVQVVLLMFSTVLVGAVVGKISSVFVAKSLLQGNKMKKYKNFVVICNWNSKAKGIILELLRANEKLHVVVVHVVAPDAVDFFKEHERAHFQQSDPMRYEVLKEVGVLSAKSVIMLSDEGVENPDDKNVLIALAVKHLDDEVEHDVHVVAELTDIERKQHLLDAGADEVICSTDYTAGIIAQSAIYNSMSEVYERLLSYSKDTNEIYFVEGERKHSKSACYPASFIGKKFVEVVAELNDLYKDRKEPVLLIGVKRNGKIFLNPKEVEFGRLELSDDLIIMSYQKVVSIG